MSLKDRLTRLTGEAVKSPQADAKQEKLTELRRKIDEVMNRRERLGSVHAPRATGRSVPLEHVVPGEEVKTPHGSFFFSRSSLNPTDFHGHARVCDLACPCMEAAFFLAGSDTIEGLTIEDGLFLDTETTGLAGGTGTLPFLIGLGWFEAGTFVTCQLFARDFSEERAMLSFLSELAAGKGFLVTFNGRAYDLNLLAARFILNRFQDVLAGMPHIDLLHPSRRMLGHRLENARLVTIESQVLGVRREGDVPGYEIPQRYFDWLKRRDGRLLEDVFRHNRLDIVSMAALLRHLTDLVACGGSRDRAHEGDLLAAARLHHERGGLEEASRMYEELTHSGMPSVAQCARQSLSLIHKKAQRWEEAAGLWREMIDKDPYDLFAVEELAKFYEHHARLFEPSVEIVQRVLEGAGHLGDEDRRAFGHRLQRLLNKMAKR
ncbi:MAG TPA: ribonuclease H-like domain-containing protein [Desulfomonilia bacterium]|nr:ribonuclease H-like domain-containing protein [Desulfomonilia bacterium]